MFTKALLLSNGHAGQTDKRKQLETVTGILAEHIQELTLVQTQHQGETERICREKGELYDLVLVLGGDGTVHECINGLAPFEKPPTIAILPGGTCNDFSRALQIPQQINKAAECIVQGHIRKLDIGQVNGRYFSNFFGIGLITETSKNVNQDTKDWLGRISYYISALQSLQEPQAFRFKLITDQEEIEDEAVMILVANGNFIGAKQIPVEHSSLDDGLLDVFIIREGGPPLLKEYFSARVSERLEPESNVIQYLRTAQVTLQTDIPMKADTDGEVYIETPAKLSVIKQKLPFIVGGSEKDLG